MKNISKLKILLIFIITVIYFFFFIKDMHETINKLSFENEELKKSLFEENNSIGGAETAISNDYVENENFIFPILEEDYLITSPYGIRVSPILNVEMKHQGVDLFSVYNAQVVAVKDGVVIEHWPPPGTPHPNGGVFSGHPIYGGLVVIEHEDGFKSLYAHLSWTRVFTNKVVRQGEIVGRIGDTGVSTGQHLHFEIMYENETVNPLLYIELP